MIESLFYSLLLESASLSSMCGGANIFPLVLPDSPTFPAITFRFVGGTANPTLNTSGLTRYRVEVNCWGNTYSSAVKLRHTVKTALNGYYDANMSIQWTHNLDLFDHEILEYRAVSEYYLLSTL